MLDEKPTNGKSSIHIKLIDLSPEIDGLIRSADSNIEIYKVIDFERNTEVPVMGITVAVVSFALVRQFLFILFNYLDSRKYVTLQLQIGNNKFYLQCGDKSDRMKVDGIISQMEKVEEIVILSEKVRILFLTSDPSDIARLRLGQELRDVRERLKLARERDRFILDSREATRPGDITQAIFDVQPQIVHFSGHGTGNGELCFEDESGQVQTVSSSALASVFKLVANQVSCVLLNACYTKNQAKEISNYIPFVIGMSHAIGDKAAIAFSVGFYKALGANYPF